MITDDNYYTVAGPYNGGYTDRWHVNTTSDAWPDNFVHFRDQGAATDSNGSFVRATDNGEVYSIVGGAPVYVSGWSAWGGVAQPVQDRTRAQIDAMPRFPADGTFVAGGVRRS